MLTLWTKLWRRLWTAVAAWTSATAVTAASAQSSPASPAVSDPVIALVGGTVIDGNGGAPVPDQTVIITGDRITQLGPRATTAIPQGAWQLDVHGKYLTPGLIDANVHASHYIGAPDSLDADGLAEQVEFTLRAAKEFLTYGVTTVRDTYGLLRPLLVARDSLRQGSATGARLLVAGPILGLDGAFPEIRSKEISQGMGRNLLGLEVDSLRGVVSHYLDRGVDLL
jgi:imidazolonepropionase-like amidohydrolase